MSAGGASDSSTGGSQSMAMPSMCTSALRQELSLVQMVSMGVVSTLSGDASDRTLYIDASAGGVSGGDKNPWVYISLSTGQAVAIDDWAALTSKDWDLAFKRYVVRTNSGDSGPGQGGAIRVALAWDKVTTATLGAQMLPSESLLDGNCMVNFDANGEVITTFTDWDEYDEASHVLNAADVVYITASASGKLYKVKILDYYSTPQGVTGGEPGHYKLRIAPL
jgi:hypothetical protein